MECAGLELRLVGFRRNQAAACPTLHANPGHQATGATGVRDSDFRNPTSPSATTLFPSSPQERFKMLERELKIKQARQGAGQQAGGSGVRPAWTVRATRPAHSHGLLPLAHALPRLRSSPARA